MTGKRPAMNFKDQFLNAWTSIEIIDSFNCFPCEKKSGTSEEVPP